MGDERSTLPIAVSIRFLKTLVQSLTSVFGRPFFRARSSAGRAPGLHPGGRRFDPGRVHQRSLGHTRGL